MTASSSRRLLLAAFLLSGFSGLIYESLWTHYLKLFLGHAAYAQTLVLVIFMGGLASGAALCSRLMGRWPNLLVGYAVAEVVIGLVAFAFHDLFVAVVDASYASLIPALGNPALVVLVKWSVGAALILPQSVLLGMTFPLMAGGFIRAFPDQPGKSLASLYFCNSLGGALGVLASGFVLVPRLGLRGTGMVAGLLNLLLVAVIWRVAVRRGRAADAPSETPASAAPAPYILLLVVSLLTGAASFIYEIGWIRMLSLVLGSSTQAFELMLSAFILGLAFGGLWIRRRVDRIETPIRFLGHVQVAMGVMALATLPLYAQSFGFMRWLVETLPKTDAGYLQFNLASHAIALAIMLPATFLAGTTLPLITYTLVKAGRGEGSIGAVYAANTVGAIAGVIFAVHVGLPFLGLQNVIVVGAALDMALGIWLLWTMRREGHRGPAPAVIVAAASLVIVLVAVRFDQRVLASGVFRAGQGVLTSDDDLLFHRDGKTATVDVTERGPIISIRTNGKIDATVNMTDVPPRTVDEPTQVLSALLPLMMHPSAKTAANIGFGSGITTHVLLSSPNVREVDSIEIEPAMLEGARFFRPRNERAYADARSRLIVDDAKTYFSSHNRRYDLIISEPSNPWVSGTASLFSVEFYQLVRRQLQPQGLFVQWLQMYEFDLSLMASVLRAVDETFPDYAVYVASAADLLIVASNTGPVPAPGEDLLQHSEIVDTLRRIDVRSVQDLKLRKVATRALLAPWLAGAPVPANSDYHPYLAHRAPRARFLGSEASGFLTLGLGPLPILDMLTRERRFEPVTRRTDLSLPVLGPFVATAVRDLLRDPGAFKPGVVTPARAIAHKLLASCDTVGAVDRREWLYELGSPLSGHLAPEELQPVWQALRHRPCWTAPSPIEEDWMHLFEAVGRRQPRDMVERASKLLVTEPRATERHAYLLGVAMLGHLVLGEDHLAADLWRREGQPLPAATSLSMSLAVLAAHASGAAVRPARVRGAEAEDTMR